MIGHADRARPLHDYLFGLVMPGERKSVESMAAITAPEHAAAPHQSLLHFIGAGGRWSDDAVLRQVRELVLPKIECYGPIGAWIIDDTGVPKKAEHSFARILRCISRNRLRTTGLRGSPRVKEDRAVESHSSALREIANRSALSLA